MLCHRVMPIVLLDGYSVVKSIQYRDRRNLGNPISVARVYNNRNVDELVLLDIDASKQKRRIDLHTVTAVASECFMPLSVGGGIRTFEDVRHILKTGADKVSINSAHVHTPEIINQSAESFGSQCIGGAVDVLRRPEVEGEVPAWEIYINGGRKATGIDALEWVEELVDRGAGELVLNSIDADGTREGYDLALNQEVARRVRVPIVASGGAGNLDHIYEVLTEGEASAALAASIFHFQQYSIPEVKDFLRERGVVVRQ